MYTAEKKGTAPEEKEPNLSRHMLHSFRLSLNASREGAQGQQGKTPFSCPALAVSRTCWSTHPHTKITISHTISKCIHIHIYVHIDTHSHEHVDKIRPSRVSRGKNSPENSRNTKKNLSTAQGEQLLSEVAAEPHLESCVHTEAAEHAKRLAL